jgi:hypothetical protein
MQYVVVAITMCYFLKEENDLYTKNMDSKQTVINTGVIKLNLKWGFSGVLYHTVQWVCSKLSKKLVTSIMQEMVSGSGGYWSTFLHNIRTNQIYYTVYNNSEDHRLSNTCH